MSLAKELARAARLGLPCEQDYYNPRQFKFDVICNGGPWYGTRWRGVIDLDYQQCRLHQSPTHPHIVDGKLCIHDLPDGDLLTWVHALISVWHVTEWDDAWQLEKCVEEMVEDGGPDRDPDTEPDLLAQYRWIKHALKEVSPTWLHAKEGDSYSIAYYRELIADLCGAN